MGYKIVIWDLDDTFWKGTLSEGKVEPIEANIHIVKNLTDRGIMNSIVSKNDHNEAMKVLNDWDLAKYFIFPHISWEPKGESVKALLEECGLRADDALFIDDNPSNLEEVKYYNPTITCKSPGFITVEILNLDEFKGKDDKSHSRLHQYKILEERTEKKKSYSSNIEFLRSSHIKIKIGTDCIEKADRICELIQRTNQLNYTKNRMDKNALVKLLGKDNVSAAYIEAKDDFGSYGIIGFYMIQDNALLHFLFSCRILGFGIENYLYRKLGFPHLDIKGDVATLIENDKVVDWIEEVDNINQDQAVTSDRNNSHNPNILFIGGCDLAQASAYLETKYKVRQEFTQMISGKEFRTSDTAQLIGSMEYSPELKKELCEKLPFMNESVTFSTKLFNHEYGIIIISLVDDFIRGIYQRNDGDYVVTFGTYWQHEKDLEVYSEQEKEYFEKNFTFVGRESPEIFKSNVEKIISKVSQNSKLILINGIDIDVSDWIGEDRCQRNKQMNAVIDQIVAENTQVSLVDMRKIVTDRRQLPLHENRHFERKCYYLMAQEIMNICASNSLTESVRLKPFFIGLIEKAVKRVIRKAQKIIGLEK